MKLLYITIVLLTIVSCLPVDDNARIISMDDHFISRTFLFQPPITTFHGELNTAPILPVHIVPPVIEPVLPLPVVPVVIPIPFAPDLPPPPPYNFTADIPASVVQTIDLPPPPPYSP